MKTISEASQTALQTASDGMQNTVTEQAKRTQTPSAGYGTKDLTVPGTFPKQRPQPDEVRDILWKLSTIKPWQIKPEDQKDVKNALSVLAWATIPATIDEAVYWLTRLLAHFPRRDSNQDAVVISDLAADMFDAEVSLVALVATCDEVRKAATKKDPWLPPSGHVLKLATERTDSYRAAKRRLENPPRALPKPEEKPRDPQPWEGKIWDDMDEAVRSALWAFLEPLGVSIRQTYCRVIDVDYETIREWAEQKEGGQNEGTEENPE